MIRRYEDQLPALSDFDRVFDRAFPAFGHRLNDLMNTFFDSAATTSAPRADLHEDENNYYLNMELPGVRKKGINVDMENGVLYISAKHERKQGEDTQSYTYTRSVTAPDGVHADKIKAHFEDGVLTVTLPKAEERKPRRIEIA